MTTTEYEDETTISVEAAAVAIVASGTTVAAAAEELLAAPPEPPAATAAAADSNVPPPTPPVIPVDQQNHLSSSSQHWKAQFMKLDEKWVNDSSGKQSGSYLCVCRHCHGQKIPFTGRYCRNHLKVCPVYQTSTPMHYTAPAKKRKATTTTSMAPTAPEPGSKSDKPKKRAALSSNVVAQQQRQLKKVVETIAMAHRIPEYPQILIDLCTSLRSDFVPPPEPQLPLLLANCAKEARANLAAQLESSLSDGHVLGCTLRPGEEPTSVLVAGCSFLLQLDQQQQQPTMVVEKTNIDGLGVARMVEALLVMPSHDNVRLVPRFVTMPESRARRILAARHCHMIWIPCMERHLTLIVKEAVLEHVSNRLLSVASNERVDTQSIYGRHVPTAPLMATDWGSLQVWLASKLRIQGAYHHHVHDHQQQQPDFWEDLAATERLLRPFCLAKYYLEDHPSLSSALLILLSIYHDLWSLGSEMARAIAGHVEQLWSRLEQPLFFLAFCLHPEYSKTAKLILDKSLESHGSWRAKKNPLTVYRLIQAIRFYHTKFQLPGSSDTLVADLQLWLNNDLQKLAMIEYRTSVDDPVDYWLHNRAETPELSNFAVVLLGTRAISKPPKTSQKTYHRSLIELDVMRRWKVQQEGALPQKSISPTELNRVHPENIDERDGAPLDDMAYSDSFENLWMNMKSLYDGREKVEAIVHPPGEDDAEDGPEMRMSELDALPDFDIGVTEENAAYFSAKAYCRNDKYPLARFISGELAFPKALTIDDKECYI